MKMVQGGSNADSPFELSEPTNDLGDYSMLWYGREKIGKTSMAAQFPDPVFLMCEPGGKALRIMKRDIMNWKDFVGSVDWLEAHPKKFQNVVVDTADRAAKMCEDSILQKLAIQHVSDAEWGKGYAMVKDEFAKQISRLLKLGRGVIFTSHAVERNIKSRSGASYDRIEPTMPKMAKEVLEPMVDIWAYLAYDEDGGRVLDIRGNDHVAAGHRLQEHFVGVEKIPMGKEAKAAYDNFVAAFHNKLEVAAPKPKATFRIPKK